MYIKVFFHTTFDQSIKGKTRTLKMHRIKGLTREQNGRI